MDTPKRDESRDRQREETLARRMGEALDKLAPGDAGDCPDAELIAAYHERALNPDEIAWCETHFAACARCRKILAVLAASDDTPLAAKEVARLGELLAASRGPQETASPIAMPRRPTRFDWRARWLAPALGVAAVLAIWFAIRPPWRAVDRSPSGTLIARAPMNEPSARVEPRATERSDEVAAKKAPEPDRSVLKSSAAAQPQTAIPSTDALAKKSLDAEAFGGIPQSSGAADKATHQDTKEKAESSESPVIAASPAPAPAFQAPRSAMATSRLAQAQAAPQDLTQGGALGGAVAGSAANVPAQNKIIPESNGQLVPPVLAGRDIRVLLASPSGQGLWAAGRAGVIQRSVDGGQTWGSQTSPLTDDWEAGAAISDTVCWLVGDHGAIARTMDTAHWEKITPPAASADANGTFPDWIRISANSAQAAVIESRDHRRFATEDGGKTWRAL
jgi:hypothetical protein